MKKLIVILSMQKKVREAKEEKGEPQRRGVWSSRATELL